MVQVPFPDGFRTEDTRFEVFQKSLRDQNVKPEAVAGVLLETYQGGGASFAPEEYIQALRQWCDRHQALLIFDEVQAGFGRTGTLFGFEHYGVVPDLACFGKGITSSLPLSAVLGRKDVMDLYPPGSMTSTHTGNPICVAAALASIEIVLREKLAEKAAKVGAVLQQRLAEIKNRFSTRIGAHHGKGLVAALHMVKENSREPDSRLAWDAVRHSVESGLLFFSPVGYGGANVKICPPLTITEDAILEGAGVLEESIARTIAEESKAQ